MDEPTPNTAVRKPYVCIISGHARERWIERIADPKRYEHLRTCPGCGTCVNLLHDIRRFIQLGGRYIDREIASRFKVALEAGSRVVDASFLEAFKKQFGENVPYEFDQNGRAVFVIAKNNTEGEPPILVTVLTDEMIDGTVIRKMSTDEMKTVFKRWQFEIRQKKHRG